MKRLVLGLSLLSVLALSGNKIISKNETIGFNAEEVITDKVVLRVNNCYDYIYTYSPEDGYTEPTIYEEQFQEYAKTRGFENVEVVYSCFDTPESLYSQMSTGKGGYDLVCPSEYMIMKMVHEGMVQPLNRPDRDVLLGNYDKYASKYIRNRLDSIETTDPNGDKVNLGDYAVGYMWGTLGLVFNPYYADFDTLQLIKDMEHFNVLWNRDYNGVMTVKDSLRDTFAIVLMKHFEDELMGYRSEWTNGEISAEQYHDKIQEVFNRIDDDTIESVRLELEDLKGNIFGMEVDSGKNDIVDGKIGINMAWSGDAVYSMDIASEQDIELCYALPIEGSNIWFDGWVMPKDEQRDPNVEKLAYVFLDFLSDPYYAAQNMDYTGYTSFIAGDSILELARSWYDYRTADLVYTVIDEKTDEEYEYEVGYLQGSTFVPLTYDDCLSATHNHSLDDKSLYYNNDGEYEIVYADIDEKIVKTYSDIIIVDDKTNAEKFGIEKVDLSYFFKDTLEDYDDEDMIFYSDDYYYTYEDEETGESYTSDTVGGMFYCQYPDEKTITRCCVMNDYGDRLENLLKMWEKFKSNSLPGWAMILFAVEVVGGVFGVCYYSATKKRNLRERKQRKLESLK